MTRPRVLCAEASHFSAAGLDALAIVVDVDRLDLDQAGLMAAVGDYDGLLVRLTLCADAGVLAAAPRLRAVASPTTGLDHLDLDAMAAAGIEVFHLRGQLDLLRTITSTAEHTWALLLALVRRLPTAANDVLAGSWRPEAFRGNELSGKTLGILGLGRVGTMVASYGAAFRMTVIAHDIDQGIEHPHAALVSLDELLDRADVLSVHLPLGPTTTALIGEPELRRLHPGAWLVNTARGEIVDDGALTACVRDGHLGGVAVDVVSRERLVDPTGHALVALARAGHNVVVTPHIAGATVEAVEKADRHCLGRLASWFAAQDGS